MTQSAAKKKKKAPARTTLRTHLVFFFLLLLCFSAILPLLFALTGMVAACSVLALSLWHLRLLWGGPTWINSHFPFWDRAREGERDSHTHSHPHTHSLTHTLTHNLSLTDSLTHTLSLFFNKVFICEENPLEEQAEQKAKKKRNRKDNRKKKSTMMQTRQLVWYGKGANTACRLLLLLGTQGSTLASNSLVTALDTLHRPS